MSKQLITLPQLKTSIERAKGFIAGPADGSIYVRKNFLRNANFTDRYRIVNQRGESGYQGGYGFDFWEIGNFNDAVSISYDENDPDSMDSLYIDASGTPDAEFRQWFTYREALAFANTPITISVLYKNLVANHHMTIGIRSSSNHKYSNRLIPNLGVQVISYSLSDFNPDSNSYVYLSSSDNGRFNIYAMKIETGMESTLCYTDENGELRLFEEEQDYSQELEKAKQYLVSFEPLEYMNGFLNSDGSVLYLPSAKLENMRGRIAKAIEGNENALLSNSTMYVKGVSLGMAVLGFSGIVASYNRFIINLSVSAYAAQSVGFIRRTSGTEDKIFVSSEITGFADPVISEPFVVAS